VVVEAIWQSLLGGLSAPELCSVLALLATEDRGRDRGPRGGPRRYPSAAVAQAAKQVRQLWFHFADLEREQGEQNLRPLAHDYVDFAFRWATGEPMDAIPLPAFVDIGDAIRSMKNLYSLLRQLEYAVRAAELPLAGVVAEAVRAMERDVIRRT
jgi:superfamily II RNA helicase